ncbi:hypothetical protein HDU76_002883 [Blyttiomyces sp. JEL0837]|nr:hypothetical protein HDU76_002883 [Blyttiomyces sp. JEL0837]
MSSAASEPQPQPPVQGIKRTKDEVDQEDSAAAGQGTNITVSSSSDQAAAAVKEDEPQSKKQSIEVSNNKGPDSTNGNGTTSSAGANGSSSITTTTSSHHHHGTKEKKKDNILPSSMPLPSSTDKIIASVTSTIPVPPQSTPIPTLTAAATTTSVPPSQTNTPQTSTTPNVVAPPPPSTKKPKHEPTDVVLSTKPEFIPLILNRTKNHEFRSYNLRPSIKRFWLYESSPVQKIRYIVETSTSKKPGEVKDSSGIGNDDFDKGLKGLGKFGYPILKCWKLKNEISRDQMANQFGMGVVQGYRFVPRDVMEKFPLDEMERIF